MIINYLIINNLVFYINLVTITHQNIIFKIQPLLNLTEVNLNFFLPIFIVF